ncbi:MAG TPA: four-carbon acid sugar kinase family protein [bacterium]|nr:four-carbon acid sugar kinase family protein [bacterium]HPN45569.1 four-carbon acid sugar kinase family protein [bacterium]
MILYNKIFISFYGDDFTGSTDVMESLALNGIRTALFLAPPTAQEIENFVLKKSIDGTGKKNIEAFGVAGISRSLSITQMEQELRPVFTAISKIPSDFFHYKVCSTFDSSPEVGSIGYATDLALEYFPSDIIPTLIGAPFLNRFCIFGNLFAKIDGITYRLDRHPTMSKHPVTPMHESDLRIHLGKQTTRPVELFDLFMLDEHDTIQNSTFNKLNRKKGEILLFDTYNIHHLLSIGRLIIENKQQGPQLIVGSSGVEYALTYHLHKSGRLLKPASPQSPGLADQIVALSGSCAPTTGKQIQWALKKGFADIRLNTTDLIDLQKQNAEMERVKKAALDALSKKQSVMIYSAIGPDDPAIEKTREYLENFGQEDTNVRQRLAANQGKILKSILETCGKKRTVVCGGDTSGYVARELGIYALETLIPIAPGAPLCTAHSQNASFDGLEISLKGGQNGKEKYIESVLYGKNLD